MSTVPLEVYVARVLAGEGEPDAPRRRQQALAIAIRTFTLVNIGRHSRRASTSATRRTVRCCARGHRGVAPGRAGDGRRILTYNGAPAEVFYSASCGGRTETRGRRVGPRRLSRISRACDDDVHDERSAVAARVSLEEVREALARAGSRANGWRTSGSKRAIACGRVTRVGLPGLRPTR